MMTATEREVRDGREQGRAAGFHEVVNRVDPGPLPSDEFVWGDAWLEGYAEGKAEARVWLASEEGER